MNYACGCKVQDGVSVCPKHGKTANVLSNGSSIQAHEVKYGLSPAAAQTSRIKTVQVTIGQAFDGGPLVTIHDSLCGNDSDHRPEQLRAIAAMLIKIAADAEAHHKNSLTQKPKHRKKKLKAYDV